jgi:hypothetical protein
MREANGRYRSKNPQRVRSLHKSWRESHPDRIKEYRGIWEARCKDNPEETLKVKCRKRVDHEIRHGRLTKPTICSNCLSGGVIDAHHPDYGKPLEIVWLCRACHWLIHNKENAFILKIVCPEKAPSPVGRPRKK